MTPKGNPLGFINQVVEDERYPIYAQTSAGFFVLSNLNLLCESQLDPLVGIEPSSELLLDFTGVKVWDISALLWLTLALQYYKKEGLVFRIKLPDPRYCDEKDNIEDFQKSADFLRRWNFHVPLNHVDELENILIPQQIDYFSFGPEVYYQEGSAVASLEGITEKLLSNRLVEIRDLTEKGNYLGRGKISNVKVEECIRDFDDAKIGNVLASVCGIDKKNAFCFSEHLITESLLNMQQHPNATTGLLSVSVLGKSKELILAVVDNGDSIPSTILSVYNEKNKTNYTLKSLYSLPTDIRASILHFATQPFISRKPMNTEEDIGLGLTYIKEDTINKFGGKVRIISNSVQVVYKDNVDEKPISSEWKHPWKGNLLRLSIPLKIL